jgi:hypothetical protein
MNQKEYKRIMSKLRRQAKAKGFAVHPYRDEPGYYVIDAKTRKFVSGFRPNDLYDLACEPWANLTQAEIRTTLEV